MEEHLEMHGTRLLPDPFYIYFRIRVAEGPFRIRGGVEPDPYGLEADPRAHHSVKRIRPAHQSVKRIREICRA
jgi:hypothetical protein